jgi:hypothetical protein
LIKVERIGKGGAVVSLTVSDETVA